MYILSTNQRKELDKFIKKIPESTVKGAYERWSEKILAQNERVTTSDTGEFISLSHNLGLDIQHFPQEFVNSIKNYIEFNKEIPAAKVDKKEVAEETKRNMDMTKTVVEETPKKAVEVKTIAAKKEAFPVKAVTKKK